MQEITDHTADGDNDRQAVQFVEYWVMDDVKNIGGQHKVEPQQQIGNEAKTDPGFEKNILPARKYFQFCLQEKIGRIEPPDDDNTADYGNDNRYRVETLHNVCVKQAHAGYIFMPPIAPAPFCRMYSLLIK